MANKGLSGLIEEWRDIRVVSPIGPLHGAGINDAFRAAAGHLEPFLERLKRLEPKIPHIFANLYKEGGICDASECPACELQ